MMASIGKTEPVHIPDIGLTPLTLAQYKKIAEELADVQNSYLLLKHDPAGENNKEEEGAKTEAARGDQKSKDKRHPDIVPEVGSESNISTGTATTDVKNPGTPTQPCPVRIFKGCIPAPGFTGRGIRWQACDHRDLQTEPTLKGSTPNHANKASPRGRRPFTRMPTPYPVGDIATGDNADGRPDTKIPCYHTPILRRQQAALGIKSSGFDSWTAFSTTTTIPGGQTAHLHVRVPPGTNYYTYTLDAMIQTYTMRGYLTPAVPPHTITFYVDQFTALNIIITNLKNIYPAATHFCPHLEIRAVPPPATGLCESLHTPPTSQCLTNGPVATPVAPRRNQQNCPHNPDQEPPLQNMEKIGGIEALEKRLLTQMSNESASEEDSSEEDFSDGSETISYVEDDEWIRMDDFPDVFMPDVPTRTVIGTEEALLADIEATINEISDKETPGDPPTLIQLRSAPLPTYQDLVEEAKRDLPSKRPCPVGSRVIPCDCSHQIITREGSHTRCIDDTHMYHCGCGDSFYVKMQPHTNAGASGPQTYAMEEVD